MITIRPVSDLRNKFTEIEDCVKSGKPVYLTKNGYGSMVVLSLEQYAALTDDIELKLDEADKAAAADPVRYTEKHYKLRFLPLFEEDLNEIVDYITNRLKNPIAADALVSDVQTAIRNRLSCAEAFEQYHSAKERQYPYYRITVRNYTIFYVVIDDVMEVRRIIYSRRDIKRQI